MRPVRILLALWLGLAVGGLGVVLGLTPGWRVFEEGVAHSWLFQLRGPLAAPDEVAVVTLDLDSAERLGLPAKLREWPRDIHARLIERLGEAGASVVAIDLIFERPRPDPAEDAALARAIQASGDVVLLELILRYDRPLDPGGAAALATTQQVVQPIAEVAEPALAVAPFPLPKLPMQLNHFWTFVADPRLQPTLPVAALRHHLRAYDGRWQHVVESAGAGDGQTAPDASLATAMATLWQRVQSEPGLPTRLREAARRAGLAADERRAIDALIDLYSGPSARWINFYGPPGQITTWPAHAILDDRSFTELKEQVRGRAVFIGLAELHSDHIDDFETVYSKDGVDLAGVEIAATIFANLLDGRLLEPLTGGRLATLLMGFGLGAAAIATLLPAAVAVTVVLGLALAYGWLAVLAFHQALWLPLAIPLLVQLPLGLFGGLFLQYRASRHAERNLSSGIAYYLPPTVASALAEEPGSAARTERLEGVCFISDIEHFTTLAEKRSADEVSHLLNRYFDVVFAAIRAEGGTVTDIVGDGLTVFWRGTDRATRLAACRAALAVERVVARLERDVDGVSLPTRIGINLGEVMLGGVGGSGRFAYSVIGDPVNTASRIEELNKHLGTRVLASERVVAGLDELVVRPLGHFVPYGKDECLGLVEILDDASADASRAATFTAAREAFRAGRLAEAATAFAQVLHDGADGPSRFYLRLCRADPGLPARPGPDGTVLLLEK